MLEHLVCSLMRTLRYVDVVWKAEIYNIRPDVTTTFLSLPKRTEMHFADQPEIYFERVLRYLQPDIASDFCFDLPVKMYSPRQKVIWFAFYTRVVVLLVQAVSNNIIPDHKANVFVSPEDPTLHVTTVDVIINRLLGVATRFLASASPILYWICSTKINVSPTPSSDQNTINEHFRHIGVAKKIPSHHLSIVNLEGVDNMYSKWRTFIVSKRMPDLMSRIIQIFAQLLSLKDILPSN
ncbi:unnamed protein product [Leptidea sinapis]|uniref:Uncharacterized protein n=1 Tax=Leptidea sinapis TaxID=189913 RepID=A0A5E4QKI0_9NEOP|nr:unnamed protein product [Leptidea sinapis]